MRGDPAEGGADEALVRLSLLPSWTASDASDAEALAGSIGDARDFLRRAGSAGVLPFLYWHGRRGGVSWDEALAERLREAYLFSTALSERDARLLRAVSLVLRDGGVRAVLLKGAGFRRTLYADPGLRPMQDLDLWVHPADLDAADAALRSIGCEPRDGAAALRAMRLVGCDAVYLGGEVRLPVDLHWGFFHFERCRGAMRIDPDLLWAESRPDALDPLLRHLPLWAEILHLAFHAGAAHGFREALWRLDLRLWADRHGAAADWDRILAEGRRLRALASLAWAVALVEEDGPIPIPEAVRDRLDAALGPERAFGALMRGPLLTAPEYDSALGRLRTVLALDGWGLRARAVARGLFPSAHLRSYYAARDLRRAREAAPAEAA